MAAAEARVSAQFVTDTDTIGCRNIGTAALRPATTSLPPSHPRLARVTTTAAFLWVFGGAGYSTKNNNNLNNGDNGDNSNNAHSSFAARGDLVALALPLLRPPPPTLHCLTHQVGSITHSLPFANLSILMYLLLPNTQSFVVCSVCADIALPDSPGRCNQSFCCFNHYTLFSLHCIRLSLPGRLNHITIASVNHHH
jgi:hypothetical protein